MNKIEEKINRYETLNRISKQGGIVFFGSSYFAGMNVEELAADSGIGATVYNRSLEGLRIDAAGRFLQSCIHGLQPSRIFINIGECDLAARGFEMQSFLNNFEWLLLSLHRKCGGCRIHIVSVVSDNKNASELNAQLKKLASNLGCTFIDVASVEHDDLACIRIFDMLKPYMRRFPVNFADAMLYQAV
ncbi:MAG: hypothetical protein K2F89_00260 [Treponemataceae bacterium]|nr:hypothetical protein [Treponemataceae bacterium]